MIAFKVTYAVRLINQASQFIVAGNHTPSAESVANVKVITFQK